MFQAIQLSNLYFPAQKWIISYKLGADLWHWKLYDPRIFFLDLCLRIYAMWNFK